QTVSTEQGRRPVDRLAILLYAAGVRSMMRFVPHTEPQQVRSPQNRWVLGPQSAIVVPTLELLHRLVVKCRNPQARRGRLRPQMSGRVMLRQAAEMFGQACCRLPELHVPQAP